MMQLVAAIRSLFFAANDDERGATAVEYGLLVALIAAVIILIVQTLGQQIANAFQTVVDQLAGV